MPQTDTPQPAGLKATPEKEDFAHKYTEDGRTKIGRKLLDNYFKAVGDLVKLSGVGDLKGATAIELGCGEGFSTQRVRELLPSNVKLDASEYVEAIVPRAQKRNPGIKVTQESVYELQHPDDSYNLVFLLEVLEHLDYPEWALAEIKRILKPGGYLVLGVPREYLWCALNLARLKYVTRFGNTPGHLNHWSARGIKKYVTAHFANVEAAKTPLPWTLVLARKES